MVKLDGKVAIITGAAAGLGKGMRQFMQSMELRCV